MVKLKHHAGGPYSDLTGILRSEWDPHKKRKSDTSDGQAQRRGRERTQGQDSHRHAKDRGHRRNRPAGASILDSQLPELRNKRLLFKLPSQCILSLSLCTLT